MVFGFREHFSHSIQHSKALVVNHQFNPIQATAAEPLEEAEPAGLIKNLTVSVLIHCNRHQSYIFKLSALVPAQVDPVHIDIRIPSALQGAVPPIFNVDICFLVQFTDGGRRDLTAP